MTTRVISVRVPAGWSGVVNSARARVLVTNWLKQPVVLSEFAAPGPFKLNLRLSDDEIAALKRLSGQTPSLTVRGILALNLNEPAKKVSGTVSTRLLVCANQVPEQFSP
jgi:hypothetical protein